jgi:hypothetical protein
MASLPALRGPGRALPHLPRRALAPVFVICLVWWVVWCTEKHRTGGGAAPRQSRPTPAQPAEVFSASAKADAPATVRYLHHVGVCIRLRETIEKLFPEQVAARRRAVEGSARRRCAGERAHGPLGNPSQGHRQMPDRHLGTRLTSPGQRVALALQAALDPRPSHSLPCPATLPPLAPLLATPAAQPWAQLPAPVARLLRPPSPARTRTAPSPRGSPCRQATARGRRGRAAGTPLQPQPPCWT